MTGKKITGIEILTPGKKGAAGKEMAEDVIRKSFRLPQSESENVVIKVNDSVYEIVDLSPCGVGVRLSKDGDFPSTGEKVALEIIMLGKKYSLAGKIVHMSPDYSNQYLCGIKFVKPKKAFSKELESYLKNDRLHLFAEKD